MIDAASRHGLRRRSVAARGRMAGPVLVLFFAGLGRPLPAQDAPGWAELAPLFVERCVMCHSGDHAAAGLHMDSYAGALAGSRNGPVVVPGEAAGSELIRRLRGDSQPRMPFLSYPLGADEIALVERWIEAGLPEVAVARAEPLAAAAPAQMERE